MNTTYEEVQPGIFIKVFQKTGKELHCLNKKIYKNTKEAEIAAYKSSKEIGESLSPYKCKWCSCVHIGHDYSDAEGKLVECPNDCGKSFFRSRLNDHLDICITI